MMRNTIAEWYYFAFHPHPAEPLVKSAIAGSVLDGKALVAALSEEPLGSNIFRAVRNVQAERLFKELQVSTLQKLAEQGKHSARAEYEKASENGIREAIALAAVALERVKALRRASQSIGTGG